MCSHSPIPESTISDPLKQFLLTLIEAMVLPLHLSNNESSTHQSCTVIEDESCLAEVTRFSARRGYSSAIIGDNGTIFVGAANKLRAFLTQRDKAKVESEFAKKKNVWKFYPIGDPHFGGICKKIVQSCKKDMNVILDNGSFVDKRLSTTRCIVEQTLNATPLTAVSDDHEGLTALTPKLSLVGHENASAQFMPSSERYDDLRKSFKMFKNMPT